LKRDHFSFIDHLVPIRILWAFDILPPIDASGQPILPDTEMMDGHLSIRPRTFSYHLVPRKPNVATVITAEAARAEEELVSWT
jgi:hypothetical protein